MFWDDVGAGGSGVGYVICMWMCWCVALQLVCEIKWYLCYYY